MKDRKFEKWENQIEERNKKITKIKNKRKEKI